MQVCPSSPSKLQESWDDDFSNGEIFEESIVVPEAIANSQETVRGQLRSIRDFAQATTDLKQLLADFNGARLNSDTTFLVVPKHVIEEAEAIVALAESNVDDENDNTYYSVDSKRHSAVGRSILEQVGTADLTECDDGLDDSMWDAEPEALASESIGEKERQADNRKLNFSIDALPGLIDRIGKLQAEISKVITMS
ncbi:hypothetical protein V1512DRAFT_258066 [Lipomyces arxii]|uniref:uncharacterized protein n=1 Tax=Lipomyces arxii TaxID=56418 RepID=UPI0034CE4935